jgi:hypothetical protein
VLRAAAAKAAAVKVAAAKAAVGKAVVDPLEVVVDREEAARVAAAVVIAAAARVAAARVAAAVVVSGLVRVVAAAVAVAADRSRTVNKQRARKQFASGLFFWLLRNTNYSISGKSSVAALFVTRTGFVPVRSSRTAQSRDVESRVSGFHSCQR